MKINFKAFTARYLQWNQIENAILSIDESDIKNLLECNSYLYSVLQNLESEMNMKLTYELCESQFCNPKEEYELPFEFELKDPFDVLVTKYAVLSVENHSTVAYIIATWECIKPSEIFTFNIKSMEFLDNYFKDNQGVPADYVVLDEDSHEVYSARVRFNPAKVMLSENSLSAFAEILRDDVNKKFQISNMLGVEPKYQFDPDEHEFRFETYDGQKIKVKCKQLIAVKKLMDDDI